MTNFNIKLELDSPDEIMATKEQLIQEIDQMPDSMIEQVLEFVLSLKVVESEISKAELINYLQQSVICIDG